MGVRIQMPSRLRGRLGVDGLVEVEGDTVGQCLHELICRWPELRGELLDPEGRLLLRWTIYLNGKPSSSSHELGQPVSSGDTIVLLPLVDGG